MIQINDHYYEDLTPERMAEIMDALKAGKEVPLGPQVERLCSAPVDGAKTLLEVPPRPATEAGGAAKPEGGD